MIIYRHIIIRIFATVLRVDWWEDQYVLSDLSLTTRSIIHTLCGDRIRGPTASNYNNTLIYGQSSRLVSYLADLFTFKNYNKQMTRKLKQAEPFDLSAHAESFFKKAVALSKKRTEELSNGKDELSNFRIIGKMGAVSVEQAFLVRMTDKMIEISKNPNEASLLKLSNQAMLFAAYLQEIENGDEFFDLVEYAEKYYNHNLKLTQRKNHDYAGAGNSVKIDPFYNFSVVENFGVEAQKGFITRMMDKLSRITTFVKMGTLQVKNESVTDTLRDLSVYCMLLAGYLKSQEAA